MRKTILVIAGILLLLITSSCSRAYKPSNLQKKKKRNCGDCSRWSYHNDIEDEKTVALAKTKV